MRAVERDELIETLQRLQEGFERRALSSITPPLISTPLTMQQLKVLMVVALDPAHATGRDLADALKVSVATMSGLVDRLAEHGMVARAEDPADRRVRRLSVTAEGRALVRALLSIDQSMPVPVLRRMDLADLRALTRGLVALDRAMTLLADCSPGADA